MGRSARDNDDDDDDVDADDDHGDDGDDIGDDNNQKPIIRSGQLSCTCDTAFSPASYFFNPANQPAKPTDLKMTDGAEHLFSWDKVL